jgi:uncharacterized RDD family membrane protein YckC
MIAGDTTMSDPAQHSGFGQHPVEGSGAGTFNPDQRGLAGFWIRFGARFIDGLVLALVGLVLRLLFGQSAASGLANLVAVAYFTYFHAQPAGQSLGDRVAGIRVVDADSGGSIDYIRAFIRWIVSLVSGFVLLIGYFWMLFNDRKQTWHDMAARTLVVRTRQYPAPTS